MHEPSDRVRAREDVTQTTTDPHHANNDWFDLGQESLKNDETVDESPDETPLESLALETPTPRKGNLPACSAATCDPPLATFAPRAQCPHASALAPGSTSHPARGRSTSNGIQNTRKRKPEVRSRNRKSMNNLCNPDKTDGNGTGQKDKDKRTPSDAKELVTNLSEHILTNAELSLLEKGLKFVPDRTKINSTKLLADLGEWERRMRLREYFYKANDDSENESDEENDEINKFKLKQKSFWTPRHGRDQWMDTYIELVKNDIVNNLKKGGKLNLSSDEKDAFYSLLHNENIVIRPADKGSGIVVVDKTEYIHRLHKEMTDSESYKEIPQDLTETATKTVKKLVNKMFKEGVINKDLQQYLIPKYPKNGKLKGNPKLHKDGAPFRTIVSGVNTPTERMAEVVEHELNDYVINSPTYIRDTTDFINKLREIKSTIPTNALLFCFDVEKLYPSVPRTEGIQACKEALNRRKKPIVPTDNAIEMIETVLDFNGFGLGERNYRQTV